MPTKRNTLDLKLLFVVALAFCIVVAHAVHLTAMLGEANASHARMDITTFFDELMTICVVIVAVVALLDAHQTARELLFRFDTLIALQQRALAEPVAARAQKLRTAINADTDGEQTPPVHDVLHTSPKISNDR